MNDEFIPTLTHATERDIDLMLVEELHASLEFTEWMLRQADIDQPVASWDVKHSKRRTRSRREIDIFVDVKHRDGSSSALLVENKLDASEQPDQAESYREELDVLAGEYARAATVIVCPKAYSAQQSAFTSKFDAVVEYEAIAAFFRLLRSEAGSDLVLRYDFRAAILDQAIHKHRRGYTPIPDVVVGDFNAQYVALLLELAPAIIPGPSMLKAANPRESTSMIFDQARSMSAMPVDLRPRRFAHELGRGSDRRANYVAVTFAGWGAALPVIAAELSQDAKDIDAVFSSQRPDKSRPNPGLVMAVTTEPVDNQKDFAVQREAIARGIVKASQLRSWLLDNQKIIARWRGLVEEQLNALMSDQS